MKSILRRILLRKRVAKKVVKMLARIHQLIYPYLGALASASEGGLHPKHRLTKYHAFFVDNLKEGDSVLDVGCGTGALLRDVAKKTKALAVGVELIGANVASARTRISDLNSVEVVEGDIWKYEDDRRFDVIILSNVLEHLDKRAEFLTSLIEKFRPKKFLIRVPMFEREWLVPYKKELGIEWRLDRTHRVEYKEDELRNELNGAGLAIQNVQSKWGEIYIVAIPARDK